MTANDYLIKTGQGKEGTRWRRMRAWFKMRRIVPTVMVVGLGLGIGLSTTACNPICPPGYHWNSGGLFGIGCGCVKNR